RDDRNVGVATGKRLDRLERLPDGDDLELGASFDLAAQHRGLDEPGDRREPRERLALQVSQSLLGTARLGEALPMPRDHAVGSARSWKTGKRLPSTSFATN